MSRETPASLGALQGAGKRWTPALGQEGTCRDFTNLLLDKELRGGAGLGVAQCTGEWYWQLAHMDTLSHSTVLSCGHFSKPCLKARIKGQSKYLFSNHLFKIFLPEKIHLEKRFMPSAYKCLVKEQCLHSLLCITF